MVKIFAFLELEQNISFLDKHNNISQINVSIPVLSKAIKRPLREVYWGYLERVLNEAECKI